MKAEVENCAEWMISDFFAEHVPEKKSRLHFPAPQPLSQRYIDECSLFYPAVEQAGLVHIHIAGLCSETRGRYHEKKKA